MKSRREFLRLSALGAGSVVLAGCKSNDNSSPSKSADKTILNTNKPIVLSTWNHGMEANAEAWNILEQGGTALDAVEAGARRVELDPNFRSVGYGGRPDRDGKVTLDACIMDHDFNCGSVAFIQDIKTPVSVARKVMEATPHVMLVGEGARKFALENGFEAEDLLVEDSRKEWLEWLETSEYKPQANQENHDTIGVVALDDHGNLAGACTTSGWANKIHGRVGDSPIIGAGLYVDNAVGAVCATGLGEAVMAHCSSFFTVERMRSGATPSEACFEALERIYKSFKDKSILQVGLIALGKDGSFAFGSIQPGFTVAVKEANVSEMMDSPSLI